jgi:hypothetical protein
MDSLTRVTPNTAAGTSEHGADNVGVVCTALPLRYDAVCSSRLTDFSDECTASIFKVDK